MKLSVELLHLAVKNGRLEIVIWLLDNYFQLEVNDKAVALAVVAENNEEMVRLLLQKTESCIPLGESLGLACSKSNT